MKCFVMAIIIGATGIVSKSLKKYLEIKAYQENINKFYTKEPLYLEHNRSFGKCCNLKLEA
jgi:hypothetical protein